MGVNELSLLLTKVRKVLLKLYFRIKTTKKKGFVVNGFGVRSLNQVIKISV